jgi:hypothetical protein
MFPSPAILTDRPAKANVVGWWDGPARLDVRGRPPAWTPCFDAAFQSCDCRLRAKRLQVSKNPSMRNSPSEQFRACSDWLA